MNAYDPLLGKITEQFIWEQREPQGNDWTGYYERILPLEDLSEMK